MLACLDLIGMTNYHHSGATLIWQGVMLDQFPKIVVIMHISFQVDYKTIDVN
jgi:hypothetical protein